MKLKLLIFIICSLYISICFADDMVSNNNSTAYFLKKPTGEYVVGFEDFHWINQSSCPDFNYNGKNQDDFSAANKSHCHEIMARIYYPSITQDGQRPFYLPVKSQEQEILGEMSNVSKIDIKQFNQIKSFNARISAPTYHLLVIIKATEI